MYRKLKVTRILLASTVLDWTFHFAGYETGVSVAIILALFSAIEPIEKKKHHLVKTENMLYKTSALYKLIQSNVINLNYIKRES
jgi:hypothetical protein